MKYIRTKDELGIYIEKDNEYKDLPQGTYFKTWRGVYIHEDWKLADTIEELCDRFVIEYKNHNEQRILKTFMRVEMAFMKHERYELKHIKAIYGAIWTNKGLIYVAKLNESGELKLL